MYENGLIIQLNEQNFTAIISGSDNSVIDIFIPRSVKYENRDYIIKSIGANSFKDNSQIESITFSQDSQLVSIGSNAFKGTSIKCISIPPTVTKIGKWAFNQCKQLKSIEIPTNSQLISFDEYVFFSTQIQSIFIQSSLKKLKNGWCDNTINLNEIIVSPKNNYFSFIDGKYLIGKSNENEQNYDIFSG